MRDCKLLKELSEVGSWHLATTEEMTEALGKQGVMNIKRITIRKGGEQIDQHLHPDI